MQSNNSNWALAAAGEILGLGVQNQFDAETIILKHVPFKPDVAYMEVPRCDRCWWWRQYEYDKREGQCLLSDLKDGPMKTHDPFIGVDTREDFGCVRFQEKI